MKDARGKPAVCIASSAGSLEVLQLLLEAGKVGCLGHAVVDLLWFYLIISDNI